MSSPPSSLVCDVELELLRSHRFVVGFDEVGRGALAGPLCVGAAVLSSPLRTVPSRLRDSKRLSEARRFALLDEIDRFVDARSVGWVSAQEIDLFGLSRSLRLAARRALALLGVPVGDMVALVDGPFDWLNRPAPTPLEPLATVVDAVTLVKADDRCPSVAAASVVAKCARDRFMRALDGPYGFSSNVGYGTRAHRAALAVHGPSAEHRLSWLS